MRASLPFTLLLLALLPACDSRTSFGDPKPAEGPTWLPGIRLGDGQQPLAIQGSLSDRRENPQQPPFYLFFVHAYGPLFKGKPVLAESGACPTILVRSSLPLKPDIEYVLVGRDAGEHRPIFVVDSLISETPKPHSAKP